ncbi:MAG: V-type ATPase subunit [Clostridiales bacterium]|nr:V-type ATPase subunit [Clostridiales bacterium]
MIRDLTRYGGPAAKARALYGRCLSEEDFRALASMKTVPEVTAYLKAHPGWRGPLSGLDPSEVHRNQLEDALRQGLLDEHFRVWTYMSVGGAELYQQPVWRVEQDEILSCCGHINARGASVYIPVTPAPYRKYSKIDFHALAGVHDWASLLSAVAKTDFYPTLGSLKALESGLPDMASVEWVMQSYLFSRLFSIAGSRASGKTKGLLRSYIGAQADLINISRIMRIRNYFPETWQEHISLLLPFSGEVPASFLRELYAAPGEEEAYRMLLRSPYKKIFSQVRLRYAEEYYQEYLYAFSRKLLRAPVPSAFSVIAYLNLKEIEVQNIIKTTECVRYGKTPASANVSLVPRTRGTSISV